jgi:hypothetical protein
MIMRRTDPLAHLPALIALALAATSLPARSQTVLISLCSGGSLPGQQQPARDCDTACHIGCTREKRGSGRV